MGRADVVNGARGKLAAVLIVLAVLLTAAICIPSAADAAEVTVSDQAGLEQALSNASSDEMTTITLSGDISLASTLEVKDGAQVTLKGGSLTAATGDAKAATFLAVSGAGTKLVIDGTNISGATDSAIKVTDGAELTVNSGTFSNNFAGQGAVINAKNSTVTVNGGTFENNQARAGGAISSGTMDSYNNPALDQSTVTINGGVFKSNHAIQSKAITDAQGNVVIPAERFHNFSGGGAVWSNGNLTVRGGTFDGNEAYFCSGGAIFLNGSSNGTKGTVAAGEFMNNWSTQLGGAIYSEENSEMQYGESTVYNNRAGHFGGGVWLCPSGQGSYKPGGSAAIFDNQASTANDLNGTIDYFSDRTVYNQLHGTTKMDMDNYFGSAAGNDLSVMYPNKESASQEASFDLPSASFDGTKVTWRQDGQPTKGASGYEYKKTWSEYNGGNPYSGIEVSDSVYRYADSPDSAETVPAGSFVPKDKGYGLAVQSTGYDDAAKENAKSSASLVVHDNTAWWSGGGIGSNGTVKFQQFGSLKWSKSDSQTGNALGGSTWTLTNIQTGEFVTVTDNDDADINKTDGTVEVSKLAAGTYTLQETKAPDGYQASSETYTVELTDEAISAGTVVAFNDGKAIANTPTTIDVTATKVWNDSDNKDGARVDATLRLTKKVGSADAVTVAGSEKTIKADASGDDLTVTWSSLPAYEDGQAVTYQVVEDEISGYTSKVTGDQTTGFTATNTHEAKMVSVKATKVWDDSDNKDEARADVTLHLTKKVGDGEVQVVEGKDQTIKADATGDDLTVTWTDLPSYEQGKAVVYGVSESSIEGYSTTITGSVSEGFTVTNKHELTPRGAVMWTKTDANTGTMLGGSSWTLTNTQTGKSVTVADNGENDDESTAGIMKVGNLLPGTYTLAETEAPAGYVKDSATYTVDLTATDIASTGVATFNDGKSIANVPTTIDVTATKVWNDSDNKDGIRADVTLHLMKKVGDSQAVVVAGQDKTIKSDATGDDLKVIWSGLPAYEDGQAVTYSVLEDSVNGYTTSYEGDQDAGFTITNTHVPSVPVTPGTDTPGNTPGNNNPGGSSNTYKPSTSSYTATTLPKTSDESLPVAAFGIAALAAGVGFIVLARRRRA